MAQTSLMPIQPSSSKFSVSDVVKYIICILVSLIVIVPIITTLLGGFKTSGELLANPFGLPKSFAGENFLEILSGGRFWFLAKNSLIVMIATTVINVTVSAMAAFIFARLDFKGRDFIFNIYSLGLLFPFAVAILPLYVQLRGANLLDTHAGIFLPQAAFGIPGNILILRNFFRSIPGELEDAAYIDGCGIIGFFWRILLPLSRSALATIAVLVMVASWNNFLLPLLVLNSQDLWTLPLGTSQFQGQYSSDWGKILAFVSLSMLPAIIFYLFAQRQLIAGLTAGSVKG